MTNDSVAESPRSRLGSTYWLCNVIEMWERLAFYTLRPVAPIYIMQATEPGGLHLKPADKGWIYLWWSVFQSILPMFTGGFADRYGYKRTLFFGVSVTMCGYLLMAFMHDYAGFFAGILVMAFGTAFFKPGLQGTLAHQLKRENSSLGWGIFYWVVNIGGLIGHQISPFLLTGTHSASTWRNLFLCCAGFCVLNLLMLIPFPDVHSGASKTDNPFTVFAKTIRNLFERRLVAWLLIMSGFWMMMYQLWDLQPNFIEDWINSEAVARVAPVASWREVGPDGTLRVPQQILLSLNSFLIVVLVIPVSWMVRRMRTLSAMSIGMLGATAGVLVAGLTQNGWMLMLGILGFSLGEMLTGPKKSEYLGLIAPPGKKGLYLGYVNIPAGIGAGVGAWIAGIVYGHYGEKATLALKYLAQNTSVATGKWNGALGTLEAAVSVKRTGAMVKLQDVLHVDARAATQILWDTYHPQYYVWIPFAAIGVASFVALIIFGQMAKRWSDMNA